MQRELQCCGASDGCGWRVQDYPVRNGDGDKKKGREGFSHDNTTTRPSISRSGYPNHSSSSVVREQDVAAAKPSRNKVQKTQTTVQGETNNWGGADDSKGVLRTNIPEILDKKQQKSQDPKRNRQVIDLRQPPKRTKPR